ncbi:MAG: SRPBCC family protein [Phycisphaerales bacterium]
MGTLSYTYTFGAPADRVFDALLDIEAWPEMMTGIAMTERLTDGPTRVGTRFRETRVMMGREATEEMEFTAMEPGRSYTLGGTSCGCEMRFEHTLTPEGGGSRLDIEMTSKPVTLFAKVVGPIAGAMMKGAMRKCLDKDFDDLDRYLAGNTENAATA